ncbi:GNAT family N-acetyltransferase [Neobacillus sp. D3-1R]|uniref:GNAT family N-acetyltransferase n=1 Tax=Neobacillus sp. D3-1R TaxID=3445778 RepID=UPI003F9F99B2
MKLWDELFELNGETIKLVPMQLDQIDDLWEAAKPEIIWEFTSGKIGSLEDCRNVVGSAMIDRDKGTSYPFVIIDKKTNQVVGSTRFLDILPFHKSVEIGWTWYNPNVWRTRVNTECKLLLLEHAFEKWDLNRVQLKTDLRNVRSQKAIERIGGIKEGILRQDRVIYSGYTRDTVFYSILKQEWPQVRGNLQNKLVK